MKILIADSDKERRKNLIAGLRTTGHDFIEAANGKEAWEALEKDEAKMLIVDRLIPGMDALEIIRRAHALDSRKYVYTILASAKESDTEVLAALNAGADDYLTKPFDQAEPLARVRIGERILGLESRLVEMATRDELTGALSRRAFLEGTDTEMKRADRSAEPFGLIMLDIDDFKRVNGTYGHSAGDEALRLTCEIIFRTARPYDLVCRWGGEEFIVLLPRCTAESAATAAERMRNALESEELRLPGGAVLCITASFGVAAQEPGDVSSFHEIIKRADDALSEAKRAGKNRVAIA